MAIAITVGEEAVRAVGIDPNSPPDIIIDIKGPIFTIKLDARNLLYDLDLRLPPIIKIFFFTL